MDLFQVTDVFGELVSLPVARWQEHILATHPEMQPYVAEIEDAIAHRIASMRVRMTPTPNCSIGAARCKASIVTFT